MVGDVQIGDPLSGSGGAVARCGSAAGRHRSELRLERFKGGIMDSVQLSDGRSTETQTPEVRSPSTTPRSPSATPWDARPKTPIIAAGSLTESVAGATAVVLAILSLAGMLPTSLLAIATIALGVALTFEGGTIAGRYSRLLRETIAGSSTSELGGGMGVEMLAGIGGIVLGVLALLNIFPAVLCSVAVIVFGGTFLLSSGATARLNQLEGHYRGWSEASKEVAREATQAASGVRILTGIGAVVLGILALLEIHPFVLSVVGILVLSGAILLSGAALGGRMVGFVNRE